MLPRHSIASIATFALASLTFLAAADPVWGQSVKMYDKVPTVDELGAILVKNPAEPAPKTIKFRKIEMYGDTAPPAGTAGQGTTVAAPAPVPAAMSGAVASAPEPAAAKAPKQTAAKSQHSAPQPRPAADAVGFNISFAYNSAEILPDSTPYIDVMGQLLQKQPELTLLVEGHTDAAGSDIYNQELSSRRAEAVRSYLITKYSIDASRLKPLGMGESSLLYPSAPNDARNRRVQFRPAG